MMKKLVQWAPMACVLSVLILGALFVACDAASGPTAPQQSAALGGVDLKTGTADGEPPSVEQDCDGLTGVALGLCTSYCEAMDCHLETPNASAQACAEALDRYVTLTGTTPPCESGPPSDCGDGICNAGDGEDCLSCAADCRGQQSGAPHRRFCCGDGDGQNPLPCSDPVCSTSGFSCTDIPSPAS